MKNKKYNGWTNYETWLVALWLDNDEETYNKIRSFKYKDLYTLAGKIKILVEGITFTNKASLRTDLLNAALSEVNFQEIAETINSEKL